jgi:F420-0:gamma-glutamyl ligase-like protein
LPFTARRIRTKYWRPETDFVRIIVDSVADYCADDDIIAISEKAISVAMGHVVDEACMHAGLLAKALARIWTRLVWGYLLGPLCQLSTKTLWRLKRYPIPEGEAHKQVALEYAGLAHALLHYSEGGIDVTNLPYTLACLPLSNPEEVSERVLTAIKKACSREVSVMIIDTDKTYSWNGIHITSRPNAVRGVRCLGLLAFMLGRILGWRARATPLATCGRKLSVEEALAAADVADRAMGYGAGRTVWDMTRRFRVGLTEVTWEMLDGVRHYPIVLVRKAE